MRQIASQFRSKSARSRGIITCLSQPVVILVSATHRTRHNRERDPRNPEEDERRVGAMQLPNELIGLAFASRGPYSAMHERRAQMLAVLIGRGRVPRVIAPSPEIIC